MEEKDLDGKLVCGRCYVEMVELDESNQRGDNGYIHEAYCPKCLEIRSRAVNKSYSVSE